MDHQIPHEIAEGEQKQGYFEDCEDLFAQDEAEVDRR